MTRRLRALGVLLVGVVFGSMVLTPVGAHFTQNTRHLGRHAWTEFIKDRVYTRNQTHARFYTRGETDALFLQEQDADDRYYTKTQSNDRFYKRIDADSRFMRHLGQLPLAADGVDIGWTSGFPTIVLGTVDVPDDCGRGLTRHTLAIDVTMNSRASGGTGYIVARLSPQLDGESLGTNVFATVGGSDLDRSKTTHIRPMAPDVPPGRLEVSLKVSSVAINPPGDDPPSLTLQQRYGAVTSLGFMCVDP